MENSHIQRRDDTITINELPDDLLLKILSSFSIKDVVARVCYQNGGDLFGRRLDAVTHLKPYVALNRSLRELRIDMVYRCLDLNEILYINNISSRLETLVLEKLSLVDVPSDVSLKGLKTLHVLSVKFSSDESVKTLLSICPRLEDLVVRQSSYNTNVEIFTINVPTLTSLSIYTSSQPKGGRGVHGFVINTPSLKNFSIRDSFSSYLRFENMPNLVRANVNIVSGQPDSLSSHLEIFEWRRYYGTGQERKVAKHILANASRLKKATFYSESGEKHGMMVKDLECAARGSKACQLVIC
ncbi:unnamed protein product [Microthlaspi erraticum]|uniref:FBD domain-containing protein n=1 Tax=Microthlaspi erraticum TaxID=1685480 RepID=A0A6D2JU39_9BRAS|nr:unnamed protein product [Microthlaspi erraticum]